MNLVIDDAVEVKQATKTDEEKRRELGIGLVVWERDFDWANRNCRPDTVEGRQCIAHSSITIMLQRPGLLYELL